MTPREKIWISGFSKGLISERYSRVNFPDDAVSDGLNFRILNGMLLSREGAEAISIVGLPSGCMIHNLHHAYFPRIGKHYLVAHISLESRHYLYAALVELPQPQLTFQFVYEFSSPQDKLSFATFGDRLIIAGPGTVPLIFSGGLSNDGSDWPFPIHVLFSEDNLNSLIWLGDEVLDKNDATAINIGTLIQGQAFLVVRGEAPHIKGLWLDFQTLNTQTDSQALTFFKTIDFKTRHIVAFQSHAGSITKWQQRAGRFGRFTDDAGNPISLGTGGQAEYVVPSDRVIIGQATRYICDFVGGGTSPGAVQLSDVTESGAVSTITGLDVPEATGGLAPRVVVADRNHKLFGPSFGGYEKVFHNRAIRQIITGSSLLGCANRMRVKISLQPYNSQYFSMTILGASIMERGTDASGAANPVQLTFNGGDAGVSLGPDLPFCWTDPKDFVLDTAKNYLICLELARGSSIEETYGTVFPMTSGPGYYKHLRESLSGEQYSGPTFLQRNVVVTQSETTGFVFVPGKTIAIVEIQCENSFTFPVPNSYQIAMPVWSERIRVNDATSLLVQADYSFEKPLVTQSQSPSGGEIYFTVTFDEGITYKVWTGSAWRSVIQDFSGTWKYNNSATGFPNWVVSSDNSPMGAYRIALTISQNRMTVQTMVGMTSASWAASGGFIAGTTQTIGFIIGMWFSTLSRPVLSRIRARLSDASGSKVYAFDGRSWIERSSTDGTIQNGIAYAQDGAILIDNCWSSHGNIGEISGFWSAVKLLARSPGTTLSRVAYRLPVQPLQSIGTGGLESCLTFAIVNPTTGAARNYAVEVSDEVLVSYARAGISPPSWIAVGHVQKFNAILIVPTEKNNTNTSSLIAKYWNGTSWQQLVMNDGTIINGKTFCRRGMLRFVPPSDWKQCSPAGQNRGFYISLEVSSALSTQTRIAEVKVMVYPEDLKAYNHVEAFKNRLALIGRVDETDRVDISGEYAEYDWTSQNAGSFRVGSSDAIQAAKSAFGGLVIAKPRGLFFLSGTEIIGYETPYTPVNSRVIQHGVLSGESGTVSALFYLGPKGAYAITGLHLNTTEESTHPYVLSRTIDWWEDDALPRIDKNWLHLATGATWDRYILWAVPMITASGQSAQTENNMVIVYDIENRAWLSPWSLPVKAFCPALSHFGEAGHGIPLLYAVLNNNTIVRLFRGGADPGSTITFRAKSGRISPAGPGTFKSLLYIRVYGIATGATTIRIWNETSDEPKLERTLLELIGNVGQSKIAYVSPNLMFRTLRWEIESNGIFELHGLELHFNVLHEYEGQ